MEMLCTLRSATEAQRNALLQAPDRLEAFVDDDEDFGDSKGAAFVELDIGGRTVKVTNPDKVYFAERGETKLDHVQYYVAVGEGIVRTLYERPTQLKRHPGGAESDPIYQKRVPEKRPDWIEVARVTFPSGRHADELCVTEVAQASHSGTPS